MFMGIARVVSMRSTCHRLNVGAIIVCDNNIVAMGYNGSPPGQEHCLGNDCSLSQSGGCTKTIHAEMNAWNRLSNEYKSEPLDLYVTHSPCLNCAKVLIEGGSIKRVFYEVPYRNTDPITIMLEAGIEVYQHTPSGYLLDHYTGRITVL